jgi:hypothetical protein
METLKPASKGTQEAYNPQGSGMEHDGVFARLAPGITNTGNMKHKWGEPGAHSQGSEPPSEEKSE